MVLYRIHLNCIKHVLKNLNRVIFDGNQNIENTHWYYKNRKLHYYPRNWTLSTCTIIEL